MPLFRIHTNVPKEKIPKDFIMKTVDLLVKTMVGKKKKWIVVSVLPGEMISWSGTTDPCASAQLLSIGSLGKVENKKIASVLHRHVEKELGVASNRMYIHFVDVSTSYLSNQGTTFDEIEI